MADIMKVFTPTDRRDMYVFSSRRQDIKLLSTAWIAPVIFLFWFFADSSNSPFRLRRSYDTHDTAVTHESVLP